VSHAGLALRGVQETVSCRGVRCTPDHEFWDGDRFIPACQVEESSTVVYHDVRVQSSSSSSSSKTVEAQRFDGAPVWHRNSVSPHRVERDARCVGGAMSVRSADSEDRQRVQGGALLLQSLSPASGTPVEPCEHSPQVPAPNVRGVPQHASTVPQPPTPGLQELWRAGDRGVRSMETLRGVFCRHERRLESGVGPRPDQQRRKLHPGELSVGDEGHKRPESEDLSRSRVGARCGGAERNPPVHTLLEADARSFSRARVSSPGISREPVYDLLNCGPRRRFAVRPPGASGQYLIAHNCTQAVARDVFAHNVLLLVDAGIQVLFTVHDEAVCAVRDEAEAERARQIMATVPAWLAACPVDAEVAISDRYKK
jgi:hypothetical protein